MNNSHNNNDQPIVRLAIFASGTGSNTQKIIDHFREDNSIHIALIVSNKSKAGVLDIAQKENIPALIIEKERFFYRWLCTGAKRKKN